MRVIAISMYAFLHPALTQTRDYSRLRKREREGGRDRQKNRDRLTQTETGREGVKQTCIKRNKMENIEPGNIVATVNINSLKQTNSDP